MSRRVLILIALTAAACGKVQSDGATPDAAIDSSTPDTCTPSEALRCDGDNLVVCGSDGMSEETDTCEFGCDATALACKCQANTSTCVNATETRCDASGVSSTRSCLAGCFTDGTRCNDIAPSNLLAQFLDDAETGADMVLNHGSAINTTDGSITIDGLSTTPPSFLMAAPAGGGGVQVRVFAVKTFRVTGELFVTGGPALAIVSNGNIDINGIIRSRAGAGPDGYPSGNSGTASCGTTPPSQSIAGQGGSGNGGRGGNGGAVFSPNASPMTGGAVVGTPEIIPLRGGGGTYSGVAGSGALQLVSRTQIDISAGGAIDASGAPGANGGGGGGAGGSVLLEAPSVQLRGITSAIAANGGGGGCYGTVTRMAERGRMDTQRALGCISNYGDGGLGGAGSVPDGSPGEAQTGCPVVGGAGGGGVGRIRINTPDMVFTPADGAIVSPPPSVGRLGLR